jgi:hypothetical protein
MHTRLLFTLGAAFALVLRPTAAHAQLDAFVQSIRDLAVAAERHTCRRP